MVRVYLLIYLPSVLYMHIGEEREQEYGLTSSAHLCWAEINCKLIAISIISDGQLKGRGQAMLPRYALEAVFRPV